MTERFETDQAVHWPEILTRLLAREDLDEATAYTVMRELMAGGAEHAHIAALLVALRAKGEAAAEIAGFVRAMLDAAAPITLPAELTAALVDTCGTGGDGAGTFNISTTAAVVVAAAGVPVAKHGNRAASSASGSADLLEAWGVAIDLSPELVATCLQEVGIGFLFAPTFHPAMRYVGPVRRQLGIRTVFNILGPLSNPAAVPHQVVGAADPVLARTMAHALARLHKRRALVFRGHDGLDELTTTAPNTLYEIRDGQVEERELDATALGLSRVTTEDLKGGSVADNVAISDAILRGEQSPRSDIVALNAAAAMMIAGAVEDLAAGLQRAREVLDSGAALELKDRWVATSQRLQANAPA